MKILVINCGSSSIKYKLYGFSTNSLIAKGFIEKIGEKGSKIKNHNQGIKALIADILKQGAVKSLDEISAIGHRVVHGAEKFSKPLIITRQVIRKIEECSQLAPLHNPANLAGIIGCIESFPKIPQVAVFDTAFHQSIPQNAYMYAIPTAYYSKLKVRKYGFHGTSHQVIAQKASKILGKAQDKLKLITCHLGNGCSIAAVDKGRSVDTSMGFTPLEGLMMGTRCGDIDIAAVFYIMKKEKLSISAMDKVLNKKSGFLGVSGVSNDLRTIRKAIAKGNRLAKLAYEIFVYRIRKYVGAYYFILGGADAICLSGGIGENSPDIVKVLKQDIANISNGKTKILVIPTDEEWMIASLTYELVKN